MFSRGGGPSHVVSFRCGITSGPDGSFARSLGDEDDREEEDRHDGGSAARTSPRFRLTARSATCPRDIHSRTATVSSRGGSCSRCHSTECGALTQRRRRLRLSLMTTCQAGEARGTYTKEGERKRESTCTYVCMCVCVRVYERERESQRAGKRDGWRKRGEGGRASETRRKSGREREKITLRPPNI